MADCKQDCWKCHWCWLGRCTDSSYYGQDVSVVADQPKECNSFITKEDWNKQYRPMKLNRAKELLNVMIDHLSVAERNDEVIKKLLHIGFTEDELINEFNFCEDDVKEVCISCWEKQSSKKFQGNQK